MWANIFDENDFLELRPGAFQELKVKIQAINLLHRHYEKKLGADRVQQIREEVDVKLGLRSGVSINFWSSSSSSATISNGVKEMQALGLGSTQQQQAAAYSDSDSSVSSVNQPPYEPVTSSTSINKRSDPATRNARRSTLTSSATSRSSSDSLTDNVIQRNLSNQLNSKAIKKKMESRAKIIKRNPVFILKDISLRAKVPNPEGRVCNHNNCNGKIFHNQGNYIRHYTTVHLSKKIFKCPFVDPTSNLGCPAQYTRHDNFVHHFKIHEGRVFKCTSLLPSGERCNKQFRTAQALSNHKTRHHM